MNDNHLNNIPFGHNNDDADDNVDAVTVINNNEFGSDRDREEEIQIDGNNENFTITHSIFT